MNAGLAPSVRRVMLNRLLNELDGLRELTTPFGDEMLSH
jgi:hypothetical protein